MKSPGVRKKVGLDDPTFTGRSIADRTIDSLRTVEGYLEDSGESGLAEDDRIGSLPLSEGSH